MPKFSLIRGRRLRVTRLDGCGNPAPGPDSTVVTKGFISVGLTAQVETGEPISQTNANGDICISDTPAPKFTGYAVDVSLCGVEPVLVNVFTGQRLVYDGAVDPAAIGFGVDSDINLDDSGFALELWSGVPAAACVPGQSQSFGYMLLPFLKGGVFGDFTVENGPVNFTITGAQTKEGNGWGEGPYNVVRDASGNAGPLLEAIPTTRHLHVQLTTVAPPEESEASALGIPATTATAGVPAALTPANSYAPATFAALEASSLVASPTTAWTAGQHVVLRDGSHAHWNGTDWEAGDA